MFLVHSTPIVVQDLASTLQPSQQSISSGQIQSTVGSDAEHHGPVLPSQLLGFAWWV